MDTLLQVGGWILVGISLVGLLAALRVLRREAPIRAKYDVLRLLIALGSAGLITLFLSVGTPPALIGLALVGGGLLGLVQGRTLKIRFVDESAVAARSVVSIAIWGLGMIAAQAGGLLGRAGAANVGLAVSYFSAAGVAGMIIGRSQALNNARRVLAPTALVGFLALMVLGAGPPRRVEARAGVQAETFVMDAQYTGAFLPGSGVEDASGFGFTIAPKGGTFHAEFAFAEGRVSDFSGVADWSWVISGEGFTFAGTMESTLNEPTVTDEGDTLHFEGTGQGTFSYPDVPEASGAVDIVWAVDWNKRTGDFTGNTTFGVPEEGVSEAVGGEFSGSTDPLVDTTTTTEADDEDAAGIGVDRKGGVLGVDAGDEEEIPVEQAAGASAAGLIAVVAVLGVSLAEAGMGVGDVGRALGRSAAVGRAAGSDLLSDLPPRPPPPPSPASASLDLSPDLAAPPGSAPPGSLLEGVADATQAAEQGPSALGGLQDAGLGAETSGATIELGEIDPIVSGQDATGGGVGTSQLAGDFVEDTAELASDAVEDRALHLGLSANAPPAPPPPPPPPPPHPAPPPPPAPPPAAPPPAAPPPAEPNKETQQNEDEG